MSGGRRGRRPAFTRPLRKTFLIVCEGEQTEPNYFLGFPVPGAVEVVGTGFNTLSLVKAAEALVKSKAEVGLTFEEVWCVFDKDDCSAEQFNAAIRRVAEQSRPGQVWGAAWSNQSFELWYWLHFAYVDAALHRDDYVARLRRELPDGYRKNDPSMFARLLPHRDRALAHARRLSDATDDVSSFAARDPCTQVGELVRRLCEAGG